MRCGWSEARRCGGERLLVNAGGTVRVRGGLSAITKVRPPARQGGVSRTGIPPPEGRDASRRAHDLRRSGRRDRRAIHARRRMDRNQEKFRVHEWRDEGDDPALQQEVELGADRRPFRLLLLLFPVRDALAKGARMGAIERRLQGPGERLPAGPFDEHLRPRHRLQHGPMPADARQQGEHDDEAADSGKDRGHRRDW